MSSMSSAAAYLRDLAAWTDRAARWLEQNARRPNDDADPTQRTITFDAAVLDDFLTGFRELPEIVEVLAKRIDKRPEVRVITGGRRPRSGYRAEAQISRAAICNEKNFRWAASRPAVRPCR